MDECTTGCSLLILSRTKVASLGNARLGAIEAALRPLGSMIREIAEDPDRIAMRIVELSNEVDQVCIGTRVTMT